MSIESSIEKTIREAIARGEFDDLAGTGKPLDLSAYFNTPEELRMAYSLLKSNDFVPEEVELMKEIAVLRQMAADTADPGEKEKFTKEINGKTLALNIALERTRRGR